MTPTRKKKKSIIFSYINNNFKVVLASRFTYKGLELHIRKDFVYVGDKKKNWIITEVSSGAMFCYGETLKHCLIYMDLLFESYSEKEITEIINSKQSESFRKLIRSQKYY